MIHDIPYKCRVRFPRMRDDGWRKMKGKCKVRNLAGLPAFLHIGVYLSIGGEVPGAPDRGK